MMAILALVVMIFYIKDIVTLLKNRDKEYEVKNKTLLVLICIYFILRGFNLLDVIVL